MKNFLKVFAVISIVSCAAIVQAEEAVCSEAVENSVVELALEDQNNVELLRKKQQLVAQEQQAPAEMTVDSAVIDMPEEVQICLK